MGVKKTVKIFNRLNLKTQNVDIKINQTDRKNYKI
jgi:hypothetical protein